MKEVQISNRGELFATSRWYGFNLVHDMAGQSYL